MNESTKWNEWREWAHEMTWYEVNTGMTWMKWNEWAEMKLMNGWIEWTHERMDLDMNMRIGQLMDQLVFWLSDCIT